MSSETFMDQSLYVTLARIQHARRVPTPEENIAAVVEPAVDTVTRIWRNYGLDFTDADYTACEEAIADLRGLVVALRT